MKNSDNHSKRIYDKGTRTWYEVPEDQYQEYNRNRTSLRKRMQYHHECTCPRSKFWLCDGMCDDCEFHISRTISLDEPIPDGEGTLGDYIPDKAPTPEEISSDRDLLNRLIARLRELDLDADKIIELWSENPNLSDRKIAEAIGRPQKTFSDRMKKLLVTKAEVITNGKKMLGLLFKADELEAERDRLIEEAQVIADAIQQNIAENARIALDQTDYQKRYDDLTDRYEKLKARVDELVEQIQETQSRKVACDFLKAFENTPDILTEFNANAFTSLVDHLTVHSKDDIRVTFRNGQEIRA